MDSMKLSEQENRIGHEITRLSTSILRTNQQQKLAKLAQKRNEILTAFLKNWTPSVRPLKEMVENIRSSQPPLDSLTEECMNTSGKFPEVLAFGYTNIVLPSNGLFTKDWQIAVPNLLSFPFDKPIVGGCNRKRASAVLPSGELKSAANRIRFDCVVLRGFC